MIVFELVLGLLLAGVCLALLAPRIGVPWPALLALAGVVLALIPGVPEVTLDPRLALGLFVLGYRRLRHLMQRARDAVAAVLENCSLAELAEPAKRTVIEGAAP